MLRLPNIITSILFAATAGIISAKPNDKEITLNPTKPNQSVEFDPALFPGETVNLTINIQDGEANGKKFALEGNPKVGIQNEQSLWTRKGDQDSKIKFEFEALNVGHENEKLSVSLAASWKTASSGGGGSAAPEKIEGLATGNAYTKRHVFSWIYQERLQFADGESFINFTVSASENGAFFDLANYQVEAPQEWNLTQRVDIHIHGKVRTESSSKGQLGIHYNQILQGTSPDEIAFANFDLAIAKHGNSENLAEDRLPHNQVAPAPHEMQPGALVIAPIASDVEGQENLTLGKRTKLTIKGNTPLLTDGTYTLSVDGNLTSVKIYEFKEGGEPIELPKTYAASELNEPVTLYMGAEAFGAEDIPQTDKLTLNYQLPLLADGAAHELKDEVSVFVSVIEVIELSPKLVDEDDVEIPGSEKPEIFPKPTKMVERNPLAGSAQLADASAVKIAWRDMKVRIGKSLTGKKVTWSMTSQFTPDFRGLWGTAEKPEYRHRFSASEDFEENDFLSLIAIPENTTNAKVTFKAETSVDENGYTALRVNLPPIGFNEARIYIQIEDFNDQIELIDLLVPAVVVIDPGHGGSLAAGKVGGSSPNNAYSYGSAESPFDPKRPRKVNGKNAETMADYRARLDPRKSNETHEQHWARLTVTLEKDMTLNYAMDLKNKLHTLSINDPDRIKVYLTRSVDKNLGISARANVAKLKGADNFLSIHYNSNVKDWVAGPEVILRSKANRNLNLDEDLVFAERIQDALDARVPNAPSKTTKPNFKDEVPDYRGVKQYKNHPTGVDEDDHLGNSSIGPNSHACLAEIDFITAIKVEQTMVSGAQLEKIKSSICDGLAGAIYKDIVERKGGK